MTQRGRKPGERPYRDGRLRERPGQPHVEVQPGVQSLGLSEERDGLLYIPTSYRGDQAAPLVVMLHGAGGQAYHSLAPFMPYAEQSGLVLLAPDSRESTWDVIYGGYGPDVTFLDRALAYTFARCWIDPAHLAVGGFSDGASYALSLGITNGDLFSHILAFSPGFFVPAAQVGTPRVFISHGTHDTVLPIDRCSRKIVPRLRGAGYDLTYREFDGPHTVPEAIQREAVGWFTADRIEP